MGYLEEALERCGGTRPKKKRVSRKSQTDGWVNDALGKRDGDSFELFAGYESTRIFEIKTVGGVHHTVGSIDESGSIIDTFGDDIGYEFDDVERWLFFTPNATDHAERTE